jgi:cytochrome oxidase Cu insertion factor (SCO1/SenC/PrrC family)
MRLKVEAIVVWRSGMPAGVLPLLGLVFCAIILGAACAPAPKLDAIGPAPTYTLVDENGQEFDSDSLREKVVVATFIYTRCADVCPTLSANMKRLQDRVRGDSTLAGDVVLLSFSVDPEFDTPEVLRAYATRLGSAARSWHFLTGEPNLVRDTVIKGFRIGINDVSRPGDERTDIAHGNRLVLQGPDGLIYDYIHGDDFDLDEVIAKVRVMHRQMIH